MPAKLKVTQVKSEISHIARNRATVRALGLRGIGSTSVITDNPATRGMVRQVRFLVTVEEVAESDAKSTPDRREGMKLHDLRPPAGAHKKRMRVGRGIAAGKGKTAGRGTKGQKARAGGSIPPWFEGGQTPLHMRIPKLRGFKNRFKIEYEVVNVGAIAALAERGAFETEAPAKGSKAKSDKTAQTTVNQDILRAVGLVRTLDKPLKILGAGEIDVPLFVVADAFTASARTKIEAAGGSVNVLEIPTRPTKAIGVKPAVEGVPANTDPDDKTDEAPTEAEAKAPAKSRKTAKAAAPVIDEPAEADEAPADEAPADAVADTADTSDAPGEADAVAADEDEAETTSGDDA